MMLKILLLHQGLLLCKLKVNGILNNKNKLDSIYKMMITKVKNKGIIARIIVKIFLKEIKDRYNYQIHM